MRGLYFDGNLHYWEDLPVPQIKPGESLVKVLQAGICNTDREILKGYKAGFRGILGHEFVGLVEESDRPDLVGQRVVGELNAGCGQCYYCRHNLEMHCLNRQIIGMSIDGCFADYMSIKTSLLHPLDADLTTNKALFTEPLAAAFSIPNLVQIKPTARIAILGDGRLALMVGQVLALSGAEMTVFGRHEEKTARFKQFAKRSLEITAADRQAFDLVVEATGSAQGLASALSLVRSRGTIVVKSTYAEEAKVDLSQLVVREVTLKGSRCGPFEPALKMLKRGLINLPEPEYHDLCDFKAAFKSRAFKAAFKINQA